MTIYEGRSVSPGMPGVCAAVRAGSLIKDGHPLCLLILSKTTLGWDMTHFYVPFLGCSSSRKSCFRISCKCVIRFASNIAGLTPAGRSRWNVS